MAIINAHSIWVVFVLGLTALAACYIPYYNTFHEFGVSSSSSNWSNFGGYIGGVLGPIFSFFSVILIYLTFKKQRETSVLQQFESTFFDLLSLQREMMKSVKGSYDYDDVGLPFELVGGDFFQVQYEKLMKDFAFLSTLNDVDQVRIEICNYYAKHYDVAAPNLGPYYRNLYHFLKYTNGSEITGKKKKYMDIIQSQMSDAQLYCLFYNAICYGTEKVLPLLDTYGFLRNIERKSLVFDYHKKLFYPKTKFKYFSENTDLIDIE
jgi:hypothetical protein